MGSRSPVAAATAPANRLPGQDRPDAWREAAVLRLARVDVMRTEHWTPGGDDEFALVICLEGPLVVRIDGGSAELGPGDAMLVPPGHIGGIVAKDNAASLALRLPRPLLRDLLGPADPPCLRLIPRRDSRLELLSTYVRLLLTTERPLLPSTAAIADRQLTELIAHLLDPATDIPGGERLGGVKAARLKAVIAGIEQHLANPNLTAGWLAAKLGLSERYVQHLLARTGTGFSRLVRRKRLERARAMLEDRAAPHLRIAEIAYAVGFNDLSNFNHAFRRHFGRTPSEIRRG